MYRERSTGAGHVECSRKILKPLPTSEFGVVFVLVVNLLQTLVSVHYKSLLLSTVVGEEILF
jgi:hypothetical protein